MNLFDPAVKYRTIGPYLQSRRRRRRLPSHKVTQDLIDSALGCAGAVRMPGQSDWIGKVKPIVIYTDSRRFQVL